MINILQSKKTKTQVNRESNFLTNGKIKFQLKSSISLIGERKESYMDLWERSQESKDDSKCWLGRGIFGSFCVLGQDEEIR